MSSKMLVAGAGNTPAETGSHARHLHSRMGRLRRRRISKSPYLMNRISEYFGSGQRSSATSFSSLSASVRTVVIAGRTVSRM